jgi:hypothetical protein
VGAGSAFAPVPLQRLARRLDPERDRRRTRSGAAQDQTERRRGRAVRGRAAATSSTAVTTPPAATRTPSTAITTPPAATRTPSTAITTPPAATRTPSTAITTPPAAVKTVSTAGTSAGVDSRPRTSRAPGERFRPRPCGRRPGRGGSGLRDRPKRRQRPFAGSTGQPRLGWSHQDRISFHLAPPKASNCAAAQPQ